jgi:hypothetical protein
MVGVNVSVGVMGNGVVMGVGVGSAVSGSKVGNGRISGVSCGSSITLMPGDSFSMYR